MTRTLSRNADRIVLVDDGERGAPHQSRRNDSHRRSVLPAVAMGAVTIRRLDGISYDCFDVGECDLDLL